MIKELMVTEASQAQAEQQFALMSDFMFDNFDPQIIH